MIMNETERKRKAVELMKQLRMRKDTIEQFTWGDIKHCCCSTSDYEVASKIDLFKKMKKIEKEQDLTIYAAIFTSFSFGDCVTYLVVPKYEEDWKMLVRPTKQKDMFLVYAYVWNVTQEHCSEFGYVQVQADGMLKRIC